MRHTELALATGYPLILHIRGEEESREALQILGKYSFGAYPGVVHCFSGNYALAEAYLDLGFALGIGGCVTYDTNTELKAAVGKLPLDRILLETDCPFLRPIGFPGKHNSSDSLPLIIREIARLKGMREEEIAEQSDANARRIFRL